MWRKFDIPAQEEVIRDAAKEALPKVLKASGKNKTQLSRDLFDCPSALGRFLTGKAFSYQRLRTLVHGFDSILNVEEQKPSSKQGNEA